MAVDDAGLRRAQRGRTGERRLQPPRRRGVDHLEPLDPVAAALGLEGFEPGKLGLACGDDELAAFAVRHPVRGAIVIEQTPAGRA
jgi:hypothetical protein